jgi:predicted AlkP superfamily phosphohydrolase/phosphomutase
MIARKVAVIGLDAADWEFLDPWIDAGDLPNIGRLVEEGSRAPLASSNPPFSAPAWATFMTGLQPGGHGMFDFVMEEPRTSRPVLARSDLIGGAKLWEVAASAGKRCVVAGVPITWPPQPFDGVLVTGMLTPKGKSFTHPPELEEEILARLPGFRCDMDPEREGPGEEMKEHLDELLLQGRDLTRLLLERGPWDLFVSVFTTPDRVKHKFWEARETVVKDHYVLADRVVGDLLEETDSDTLVVLLSDHGFHSVRTKFYMNRWLRQRGLLHVRPASEERDVGREDRELQKGMEVFFAPARTKRNLLARIFGRRDEAGDLEVDPTRTRAYLYSAWTNGVKVNVSGRGPHGIVEPGAEYEQLRDEIIAGLAELRFPGTDDPLFDFVGRREDIYHGPRLEWAPDVVTRSKGFRVICGKNMDRGKLLRVSGHDTGAHSDTGILVLRGPGVRRGASLESASLADIMPTVLWAMGLEVPRGLDGRVLSEGFEEGVVAANLVRIGEDAPATVEEPVVGDEDLDAAEEEELRKLLEGLGYL